jgi:hypothetical protein
VCVCVCVCVCAYSYVGVLLVEHVIPTFAHWRTPSVFYSFFLFGGGVFSLLRGLSLLLHLCMVLHCAEIHGAWYDPSNPVVQFSGSLRGDLFEWMLDIEQRADLCLCLGTSLSGMNSDRCAETPAKKALRGEGQGTVIVNLQRTRLDSVSSLRVWAKLDDFFRLVMQYLEIEVPCTPYAQSEVYLTDTPDVFQVPYNRDGLLDPSKRMRLDLRVGAPICIPIEGAMNHAAVGEVLGKDVHGNYKVALREVVKRGGR